METHPVIYIIDDDESILNSLKAIITKIFPKSRIYTANNGLEGWEMFKTQSARFIVLSDLFMPELNGLQLLKMIRSSELLKNNYFILMTGDTEKDINLKALQQGADDFLSKPIAIDQLLAKLRLISRVFTLQEQIIIKDKEFEKKNKELSNQTSKLIELFVNLIENKFQGYKRLTAQITDAALWIASKMNIEDEQELDNIAKAAELIYIGRIALSEKSFREKMYVDGVIKNEDLTNIPLNAETVLNPLTGYSKVAEIISNIYENYDGSGIPKKKKANEIPEESRILRVVQDFFEIQAGDNNKTNAAIEQIETYINKMYELKIVVLMDQYTAFKDIGRVQGRERSVEIHELIEGLYISRSVYSESGIKLLGAGVTLNADNITKLKEILQNEKIIGNIWIRR